MHLDQNLLKITSVNEDILQEKERNGELRISLKETKNYQKNNSLCIANQAYICVALGKVRQNNSIMWNYLVSTRKILEASN